MLVLKFNERKTIEDIIRKPTLSVRLDPILYDKLARQCRAKEISISDGIRQLIEYLEDEAQVIPSHSDK